MNLIFDHYYVYLLAVTVLIFVVLLFWRILEKNRKTIEKIDIFLMLFGGVIYIEIACPVIYVEDERIIISYAEKIYDGFRNIVIERNLTF